MVARKTKDRKSAPATLIILEILAEHFSATFNDNRFRQDKRYDVVVTRKMTNGAQNLLIDADDTLWENNVYFERAIVRFISFLNHREYSPAQVREVLNQVERESIVEHGYGLHSFAHSLVDTFERLSVDPVTSVYLGNPNAHNLSAITHGPAWLRVLGSQQVYTASTVDQMRSRSPPG